MIKSINGLGLAYTKSINGLAVASIKSINGAELSDVLAYFDDADVTQNTAGRYIYNPWDEILYGPFGSGELATFDYDDGDGLRKYAQIHEAWDETCGYSESFAGNWITTLSTLTADQITAPDPTKLADKLTLQASANAYAYITLGSATDNTDQTAAVFVRTLSGTKDFRLVFNLKNGGYGISGNLTATAAWQRFDFTADILAGANPPHIRIQNDSGGTAGDIYIWGCNVYKDRSVPGPYMTNDTGSDAAYLKDQVSFAAGIVPAAILSGKWAAKWAPFYAEDETVTNYICRSAVTVDLARQSSDKMQVYAAGVKEVESGVITFARNTLIESGFDAVAGSVTTTGADTGDGTAIGNPWAWAAGEELRWGNAAGSSQINGLISEPYRPAP